VKTHDNSIGNFCFHGYMEILEHMLKKQV